MKTYPLIFWVCLSIIAASACTEKNTTERPEEQSSVMEMTEEAEPWENTPLPESDPLPKAPLKELLIALKDSVERNWYLAVKSDEKKLTKILQLTARMEKYPQHSKNIADSVRLLHKWFTINPLTWEMLADTDKMTTYDNNFDLMMQLIRNLRETPGSESCTICTELYEEITALYDDDLILRRRYDKAAVLFNKLLEMKQDSIRFLPAPLNKVSRKPLFTPLPSAPLS